MEPVIPEEAEIVVSARRHYFPGDILAFNSAIGDLRVHRLIGFYVRRGRLLLQMRADASGTIDQAVTRDQVIGRVIGLPGPYSVPLTGRLSAVASFFRLQLGKLLGR